MTRMRRSAKRYPARILRRSAIRLALTTYPLGSTGSGRYHRAVYSPTLRTPNPSPVSISNLRRNLEALSCPRFKVGARKFGELTPLKLLAVSERDYLVSEPGQISQEMKAGR